MRCDIFALRRALTRVTTLVLEHRHPGCRDHRSCPSVGTATWDHSTTRGLAFRFSHFPLRFQLTILLRCAMGPEPRTKGSLHRLYEDLVSFFSSKVMLSFRFHVDHETRHYSISNPPPHRRRLAAAVVAFDHLICGPLWLTTAQKASLPSLGCGRDESGC